MPDGLFPLSRFQIPEGIVHRDLEGELVLLNLDTGIYFGLDSVGTRIWHLIQAQHSHQEIVETLVREYEVTEEQCGQDLLNLITRLLEKGLVRINDDLVA